MWSYVYPEDLAFVPDPRPMFPAVCNSPGLSLVAVGAVAALTGIEEKVGIFGNLWETRTMGHSHSPPSCSYILAE